MHYSRFFYTLTVQVVFSTVHRFSIAPLSISTDFCPINFKIIETKYISHEKNSHYQRAS